MTPRAKGEQAEPATDWYEVELRETKARLHKVEGDLEQALKLVWSLSSDVRKLTESLNVTGSVANAVKGFREEVRELRDQVDRVQDRQASAANRLEEVLRQRESETGRDRQEWGAIVKEIEAVARNVEQYDSRMKALEEIARHVEEDVAGNRLANQGLERAMEETQTKSARSLEATLRLDQEVARHATEFERIAKEIEAGDEKVRLAVEQMRRAVERLDKIERLAEFEEEAREAFKLINFERDQAGQRLNEVERLARDVGERSEEFTQNLARLDQRLQQQSAQLMELSGVLQDLSDQTKAQLKRVYQVLLRQRKRQSETLNQEIKELTQGELHSGD